MPRDSRFVRAILLGLTFSCNIGGMMSVIASPQNSVASGDLPDGQSIGFLKWILVAVPFCIVCNLAVWLYILFVIKPNDVAYVPDIYFERVCIYINKFVIIFWILNIEYWINNIHMYILKKYIY